MENDESPLAQDGELSARSRYAIQAPILAVAAGDVNDVLLQLLVTVLTAIDMETRTIELMNWELKSGFGLSEPQVSGDKNRSEKSVGIVMLADLFVLRVCHHEIVPGKPWSIF